MCNSTKIILTTGLLLAGALSSGCGDKKIHTGTFVDSAVENIAYRTESINGRTDSGGKFSYKKGEVIEFYINDLSFGSTFADEQLSPVDLVSNGTVNTASVINRAILLQSLDADGDTSNGITIPEITMTLSGTAIDFNQTTEAFSNDSHNLAYIQAAKSDTTAVLVSAATAKAHLAATIGSTSTNTDPEVSVVASQVVVEANEVVILTGTVNTLITNFRWATEENSGITLMLGSESADLTQFQASFNAPTVNELTNYTIQFIGEDSSGTEYYAPIIIQVNPATYL